MGDRERMAPVLERMNLLGTITRLGNEAESGRHADFFLTDEELWALGYATAPHLFGDGNLPGLLAAVGPDDQAAINARLGKIRAAYHDARNSD